MVIGNLCFTKTLLPSIQMKSRPNTTAKRDQPKAAPVVPSVLRTPEPLPSMFRPLSDTCP